MVRNSNNPANYVNTVRVALVSDIKGQLADAFGTVVHTHKAAADGPDLNRGFSISPDNKSFVISLKTGKGFDLFVKDISSGQTIGRLTSNGEADGVLNHYPDVSPDGKWVAFTVRKGIGSKADLYIVKIDGTGLRQVTATDSVDEDRPSWSPDGKELAYQRLDDADPASSWDVYAIRVFN
jgi:Tol biopolymer transport system component